MEGKTQKIKANIELLVDSFLRHRKLSTMEHAQLAFTEQKLEI